MHTENHQEAIQIAPAFDWLAAVRRWLARLTTTRANARAGLAADSLISLLLIGAGLWRNQGGTTVAASIICCGLIFFSFIEYGFHRWLFHGYAGTLAQGHQQHHENPAGYDALPFFVPPLMALALAGVLTTVAPLSFALLLSGALAAGYAAYGLGHTAVHSWRFTQPLVRSWAANHHIHHHHPDRNFGVTTPLWDIVLGTCYVPARQAMAPGTASGEIGEPR